MGPFKVVRNTRPAEIRIIKNTRDESQKDAPLDITGYTIKLMVKNALGDADDEAIFDLEATIVDGPAGKFQLQFTTEHTCLARATYPADLRLWSGTQTGPPDDAIPVGFVVIESVEKYS